MNVILKPIITEKATNDSELRNRYTFLVKKNANKVEIKNAVQERYNVTVSKVRTQIYGPERRTKYTKAEFKIQNLLLEKKLLFN